MSDEWPHHKADNLDVFVEQQDAELLRLRAENEKLRAALKPLVAELDDFPDDDYEHALVSFDDLRAAAAAIREAGE